MQINQINTSLTEDEMRQMLSSCLTSKSPNRQTNASMFIIEGKFLAGSITTSSGEKRNIKGTAYTIFNLKTFSKVALINAIRENRIAKVLINQQGLVSEMHIHPEWIEKMEKNGALDVLARSSLDKVDYNWLKENDEILLRSVETQESYDNMLRSIGLGFMFNH